MYLGRKVKNLRNEYYPIGSIGVIVAINEYGEVAFRFPGDNGKIKFWSWLSWYSYIK